MTRVRGRTHGRVTTEARPLGVTLVGRGARVAVVTAGSRGECNALAVFPAEGETEIERTVATVIALDVLRSVGAPLVRTTRIARTAVLVFARDRRVRTRPGRGVAGISGARVAVVTVRVCVATLGRRRAVLAPGLGHTRLLAVARVAVVAHDRLARTARAVLARVVFRTGGAVFTDGAVGLRWI